MINSEQIQELKAKAVDRIIAEIKAKHSHYDAYAPVMTWGEFCTIVTERDADKALIAEQAKSIDFLKEQLAQLANFNPDWDKLEAATDSLREHMAELTEANKRIAELESQRQMAFMACNRWADKFREAEAKIEARTVTVKLPPLHVGVVQGGHAVMVPYPAGHWFNKTAILEMLAAAGITLDLGE